MNVLKRGLNWLSMMVTMAPLLGLLGTVVGMIRSFAAVGGDIGAPTVITGGVSEAFDCDCYRAFSSHRSISHPQLVHK